MSALGSTVLGELRSLRTKLDALIKVIEGQAQKSPRDDQDPDPSAPRPFVGAAMTSKYAGKCVVCGQRYDVQSRIVYSRELRKAAHLGCGQPEGR